jgi:shikimate dehydrogenase
MQRVLIGLIGDGIQLSRTPAMHEREGDRHGLRTLYTLIDTDLLKLGAAALPELLTAAERFGFTGLNVTHPFKQAVLPHLHELSPQARAIGAVNTVVLRDGKRIGHNTDCSGFAAAFRRDMADVPRNLVLQLGAGGGGSAVAHALLEVGATRLGIADTDRARAAALVAQLGPRAFVADPLAVAREADGIVNATPVGMAKYPGLPIAAAALRPAMWLVDIIYFPLETELLARARALGCRTMSGAGMAVYQAADAFRLFTGREPDADRMRDHFESM